MSYFLTALELRTGLVCKIEGAEFKHLKANRLNFLGAQIDLRDAENNLFQAEVSKVSSSHIEATVLAKIVVNPDPNSGLHLISGLINEKALAFLLQKSTELGATSISLLPMDYSQHSPRIALPAKISRWQKIIQEAGKQSGRIKLPDLNFFLNTNQIKSFIQSNELTPLVFNQGGQSIKHFRPRGQGLALIIGPEGGFSPAELAFFKEIIKGDDHSILGQEHNPASKDEVNQFYSLGGFTLRAETAAISALAYFSNLLST